MTKTFSNQKYFNINQIPEGIRDLVLACSRGSYQHDLLRVGFGETWSGSSIRGTARQWSSRYHASRKALLDRITARLRSNDWFGATSELVYDREDKRWRRHLVLWSREMTPYVWAKGSYWGEE